MSKQKSKQKKVPSPAETKDWDTIHHRIESGGILDIIDAVNRKRTELVFDPEI